MDREARIQMIRSMLEAQPADIFLQYALGLELAALPGREEDACQQFRDTLALDPAYIPAYYQLGKLYETRDRGLAVSYYKEGFELSKRSGDRKSAGEFEEAIFLLED